MITDNLAVGNWVRHHSQLHRTIEKEPTGARSTTVKPKRIFVEIVFEMFSTCSTLMNSKQPAFKQRRNSMNTGHDYMGWIVKVMSHLMYGVLALSADQLMRLVT